MGRLQAENLGSGSQQMCEEPSAFQGGGAPEEPSSSWEDGGHVWPSPVQRVGTGPFQ